MVNPIPVDLVLDICSRLPPKSIARFRCVSKQWASMLHRQVFKARPRLLFAVEQSESGVWEFFSVLQPQNPSENSSSSLVVTADSHIKLPAQDNRRIKRMSSTNDRQFSCGYASGLVYFSGLWLKEENMYKEKLPMICNPNTGHYVTLPFLDRYRRSYSFLGFDPIDKLFKVLFIAYPFGPDGGDHRIMTLRTPKMKKWRKVKCSLSRHVPLSEGICINGVLYYLADSDETDVADVIVCFDVRCETFKFLDAEYIGDDWFPQLIDYKGEKLCLVYWKYDVDDHETFELSMRILEDIDNEEWSEYSYTLRDSKFADRRYIFSVVGVIATTGEIVLSMTHMSQPIYVFYYNPETDTLRSVEIRGFGVDGSSEDYLNVFAFVDHADDFNVDEAKLLLQSKHDYEEAN